jgi:hypothetical protein
MYLGLGCLGSGVVMVLAGLTSIVTLSFELVSVSVWLSFCVLSGHFKPRRIVIVVVILTLLIGETSVFRSGTPCAGESFAFRFDELDDLPVRWSTAQPPTRVF